MKITIENDEEVVFQSDGHTVLISEDKIVRSFIFHALTGSLGILCGVPKMTELPDDEASAAGLSQ